MVFHRTYFLAVWPPFLLSCWDREVGKCGDMPRRNGKVGFSKWATLWTHSAFIKAG